MHTAELDCTLIDALRDPSRYPHPLAEVKLLETHISWVLLAGAYVYKIKKPVDFGFLDFSDLAKRRHCCQEELRLNRRLAADLYLQVIGIGGSPSQPLLGAEPAFEYAVKMRRFAEDFLLDHLLAQGKLSVKHMQNLADCMASFHAELPPADIDAGFGDAEAVAKPARQNFSQLGTLLDGSYQARLAALEQASENEYDRCQALFNRRLREGKVRECHGDLHLGNIVLLEDQATPFDGIEFNPALRWIDVINDIAFLLMDLQHRQRPDLAFAFLNTYLQASGDYSGLAVLRFYLGYRAMVMAKVSAIRTAQLGKGASLDNCERYLRLAESFYAPSRPALMITHGLPGCGKTSVSQLVLENCQAIRIRSDVERKRLFGLSPEQRSDSAIAAGIYTAEATERTYSRLLDLAELALQNGFNVIVDAAFLKQAERQQFQNLAQKLAVPFVILAIACDEELLQQRIIQRQAAGRDASEANVEVYKRLKAVAEDLTDQERSRAVQIVNDDGLPALANDSELWERLRGLLKT